MGIVYLLIAIALTAISIVFKTGNPFSGNLWLLLIYAWIPGGLGLLWSRFYKIKIPFRLTFDRYFLTSLLGGFFIGALAFFIGLYLNPIEAPKIIELKQIASYFLFYYIVFLLLFSVFFCVEEICWRGYLWEKWKNHPLKGGIAIWLLWSLWLAPATLASSGSFLEMILNTLSLMTILHFFRKTSQSILPGTFFYASLYATFIYFHMLFSSASDHHWIIQDVLLLIVSGSLLLFYPKNIKKKQNIDLII